MRPCSARCGLRAHERRRLLTTQITVEMGNWAVDQRGPLGHLAAKPRPSVIRELIVCGPCAALFCREHGLRVEMLPLVH